MEKKKFKLGLLPKLLIAIVLGIIIGQFFPVWFCRVVVTASSIFSSFLKFIIPLMIVAYVTMGIADLKSGAGKLLLITVALAYGSTLIAGSASYLVSASLFPSFRIGVNIFPLRTPAASVKAERRLSRDENAWTELCHINHAERNLRPPFLC